MNTTGLIVIGILAIALSASASEVKIVKTPPTEGASDLYVFNRPPLLPNPLAKLPIGAIKPGGWLRGQLDLMADGMTGRLDEVSEFLTPQSGWLDGKSRGWEEAPYWFKGVGDLGYVLDDRELKIKARKWLDAAIASQEDDGYFGPPGNKTNKDLWPNMVVLFALQSLYEATGDERVIPLMTKYFKYQAVLPKEDLLPGSWQKVRAGDNLESVYWLYNRTGEAWLLDLGQVIHERTVDWTGGIASRHGVNFCQAFRQPAVFYQQSLDKKHLGATERNYAEMMGEYGQVPGGMFAADENNRAGKTGAEQAAETCSIVEFMYSDESLLRITGDPKYADRCEDVAFNSLPASMMPDLKGLHYLTAPNQVQLDKGGEHCYQNGGTMVSYSPTNYRCCQHNVAQGWPYYAEHLWMATKGNGLAAVFYAPCEVRAKVGDGIEVRIVEETDYPFDDTVNFTLNTRKDVKFPLMLRIPGWCENARVSVNGENLRVKAEPLSYVIVDRLWKDGDRVTLELPMKIRVATWEKQNGGVSVSRGPLSYSLKIGEKWSTYGGTEEWPEKELFPTTPWNYGLVLDQADPSASFKLGKRQPVVAQPFTPDAAPISLSAKAKRVSEWGLVMNCPGPVPQSPAAGTELLEEITLIPMGCARLRISVFPVVR
jgi:hypothetical protein